MPPPRYRARRRGTADDLDGKLVLNTGATHNPGHAATGGSSVAGARLALLDQSAERLEKASPGLGEATRFV